MVWTGSLESREGSRGSLDGRESWEGDPGVWDVE